jgi:hypothetical protein
MTSKTTNKVSLEMVVSRVRSKPRTAPNAAAPPQINRRNNAMGRIIARRRHHLSLAGAGAVCSDSGRPKGFWLPLQ